MDLSKKQIIFLTQFSCVAGALMAMCISRFDISIVTMNTFAFGIRCAGPFTAYDPNKVVPKATKNSEHISIFTGSAQLRTICGN
jgi:SSS family solute:Na+ symporter